MNGRSYRFNTSFDTCSGNHALRCYCTAGGIASCMNLCPEKVDPENCPPGTTLREEENPVESGKSRCSCKRRSCVPAKGTLSYAVCLLIDYEQLKGGKRVLVNC